MTALLLATLLLLAMPGLSAQRADSAATARRLSREAAAALAGGDTLRAADLMLSAATAWQRQGAYLGAAAGLAAIAGRSDTAIALLARLGRMGYGWSDASPAGSPHCAVLPSAFLALRWVGSYAMILLEDTEEGYQDVVLYRFGG